MPIEQLPIFTYFGKQRFSQFGSIDVANWTGIQAEDTKKGQALYPCTGRRHLNHFGQNVLVFDAEASALWKTINYSYYIVGASVIQCDTNFNTRVIGSVALNATTWFAYLAVGSLIYALLTDGTDIYLITEDGSSVTYQTVTDTFGPMNPQFVFAFGQRFGVNVAGTNQFYLTTQNLSTPGHGIANPAYIFQNAGIGGPISLIGSATGVIRQMCTLHAQLYIFNDVSTDIWSNIPTQVNLVGNETFFPFKLSSSYNWDYGIADPFSLDVDFGMMCWLGKNNNGLISFMVSNGQQPEFISTQAINVLLQNSTYPSGLSPFQTGPVNGFLYQYENTIFYRVSAGTYIDTGDVDISNNAYSLEYNFSTKKWGRVIELNGQRNRIEKHVYFANMHLVSVQDDPAIYQMAGNIYYNELRTPNTTSQDANAFTAYPFRYELTTQQIFNEDYSEFITDYVEIDFVFGIDSYYMDSPYSNTVFIVDEQVGADGSPQYLITENSINLDPTFIIAENSNFPTSDDNHYFQLFKPQINLSYSDDGGITFTTADVRQFSPIGKYRWRMRWYETGTSRNRAYNLVCVSPTPIVILGAVQNRRRVSGGAN
jgi:hypothetical protein